MMQCTPAGSPPMSENLLASAPPVAIPVIALPTAARADGSPGPLAELSAEARLSSFLAHELATPMTTLVGLLYLLAQERLPGQAGDLADRAFAAAVELARTAHELRALPGGMPLHDVDVGEVVTRAVEGVVEARSIRLLLDAPGDGVQVRGNGGLLLRAVRNLVVNAVEAVAPGGSVGVVVRPMGSRVLISVWDDGPGIAPEHFPALFRRPFTTRANGSGLGLLLVRQVVEGVHGGTVSHQPRTPHGSTFRIELPRAASTEAA